MCYWNMGGSQNVVRVAGDTTTSTITTTTTT
jgi:hypothetical protein